VGPECNHKCPYTRDVEEDLTQKTEGRDLSEVATRQGMQAATKAGRNEKRIVL